MDAVTAGFYLGNLAYLGVLALAFLVRGPLGLDRAADPSRVRSAVPDPNRDPAVLYDGVILTSRVQLGGGGGS